MRPLVLVGTPQDEVRESIGRLRAATGGDLTAAVCEVHGVRRAFSAAIRDLALRTGQLEAALDALDRARPLLLAFDEPKADRWRVGRAWASRMWIVLGIACMAALAAGFMVGRARGF